MKGLFDLELNIDVRNSLKSVSQCEGVFHILCDSINLEFLSFFLTKTFCKSRKVSGRPQITESD